MRVVYRLKDDCEGFAQSQKAGVATESGIEPTYGVAGSPEWWEKISSGELPTQTCSGIITKRYMGSWNDWPEFTMRSGSGEESSWSRFGHSGDADKYYKVGSHIEIDYVVLRLQAKALLPGEERKIVLEVRIGTQGPANMTFSNILLEKKNSIAYVTVNRPKVLNALNMETMEELRAAFTDIKADTSVRVALLTGSGEKAFIAGADIGELAKHDAVSAKEYTHRGQSVLDLIEDLGKPVIACLNGFTLGGGCEIALACTMRLASENAKLGQPEVKLGIIPGYGGSQRLPRLVGKGLAMQMVLAGEMITAQEAYRIGLVNEVTTPAELIPRAEAIAAKIIANAPLAVQYALEAVNHGMEMTLAEGLYLEATLFGVCCATEDKKEGTTAFLEKRPPQFKGK